MAKGFAPLWLAGSCACPLLFVCRLAGLAAGSAMEANSERTVPVLPIANELCARLRASSFVKLAREFRNERVEVESALVSLPS